MRRLSLAAFLLAACSASSTVSIKGTLRDDSNGLSTGKPIPDASVCRYPQMQPCATSDVEGNYQLAGLPRVSDLAIVCSKSGFFTDVFPLPGDFDTASPLNVALLQSAGDPFLTPTGASQDSAKSMAIVTLLDVSASGASPAAAGSTVTLTPASGEGPFYIDVSAAPFTASPTSTTNSPLVLFMNLDPGSYDVTASVAGKTCSGSFGWPASSGAITGPSVVAGAALSISIDCQ